VVVRAAEERNWVHKMFGWDLGLVGLLVRGRRRALLGPCFRAMVAEVVGGCRRHRLHCHRHLSARVELLAIAQS